MSKTPIFKGCATAIATPFDHSGAVDLKAFARLIERQISMGADAVVVAGTTGECPVLSTDEFSELMSTAVQTADGRIPIIAGTGRNDTKATVSLSKIAEKCGASGLLTVNPYYNKSTQSGLVAHFTHVAGSTALPILLYNVPSRTGMSFTAETYQKLAQLPNIVGVKEASGDLSLMVKTAAICPTDFAIYSGNDDHILPVLALGGLGVISTVSNICPDKVSRLCRHFFCGDLGSAAQFQFELMPLIEAIFSEANPIPLKYALHRLGLCEEHVRLPLVEASDSSKAKIDKAIEGYVV